MEVQWPIVPSENPRQWDMTKLNGFKVDRLEMRVLGDLDFCSLEADMVYMYQLARVTKDRFRLWVSAADKHPMDIDLDRAFAEKCERSVSAFRK